MNLPEPPVNPADKLRVISDEREGLRPMLVTLQTSIHRSVFAFVTAAGVIIGVYWNKFLFPDAASKPPPLPEHFQSNLMFLLTQLEFLLGLLVVGLLAQHNVAARYIAALEMKINLLAGDTITAFERSLAPRFYHRPSGVFWWTKAVMLVFLIVLFLWAGWRAVAGRGGTAQCGLIVTLLAEITIILTLLVFTIREGHKAQSHSRRFLGLEGEVADETAGEIVRRGDETLH
jgi:hypothetical protein